MGRGPHQLKNAKIDLLILAVLHLLMHRSKGGGIVDASIILQVLMHQAGIDASILFSYIGKVVKRTSHTRLKTW